MVVLGRLLFLVEAVETQDHLNQSQESGCIVVLSVLQFVGSLEGSTEILSVAKT